PEGAGRRAFAEEPLAATQRDRGANQSQAVEQPATQKLGIEARAALDHQVRALLRLEARKGLEAVQTVAALPRQRCVGTGEHVLPDPVEGGRNRVVLRNEGPVASEDVVGAPAEQEVEGLPEEGVHLVADRLFEEGRQPAAMGETALGILLRPAGGLHDTIERKEGAA